MKKWMVLVSVWIMMTGFDSDMTKEWAYSCESGETEEVFVHEDSYIIVCGTSGVPEKVVSLSKTGDIQWSHEVKGVVQTVPETEGDRLWMVSEARETGLDYIVDLNTGERSSSLTFDIPENLLINDRTFMKGANGRLHVFAGADWHAIEQDGKRAFTFTGNEQLLPDMGVKHDSYYVADDGASIEDSYLYRVGEEGEVLWKKAASLDELPLFSGNYMWFTEPFPGTFYSLNPETGETIAEQGGDFYHRLLLDEPLLMENHLFRSSELYELGLDGEIKWKTIVDPYRLEEYVKENALQGDQWLLQRRTVAAEGKFRLFSQNIYFFNEQDKEIASLAKLYDDGTFAWTNRNLQVIDHTAVIDGTIVAAGKGHVSLLNQNGTITDSYSAEGEVKQLLTERNSLLAVTGREVVAFSVRSGEADGIDDFLPTDSRKLEETVKVGKNKEWNVGFNTAVTQETAGKSVAVVNEEGEVVPVEKTLSEDGTVLSLRAPENGYTEGTYAITVHDRITSSEGKLLKEEVYQPFTVQ